MLATTPISDLIQLLRVPLDVVPADIFLPDPASPSLDAARDVAPAGRAPSQRSAVVRPGAIDDALQDAEPGEGGFERLENPPGRSSGAADRPAHVEMAPPYGVRFNAAIELAIAQFLGTLTEDADARYDGGRSNDGLTDPRSGNVGNNTSRLPFERRGRASDDAWRDYSDLMPAARDQEGFNEPSPPSAKLELDEVVFKPGLADGPELSFGEGEFVRLSVSTSAERISPDAVEGISIDGEPDSIASRWRDDAPGNSGAGAVVTPVDESSVAWQLQLTPTRRVCLTFNTTETSVEPSSRAAASSGESSDKAVPNDSAANPESPQPHSAEATLLPASRQGVAELGARTTFVLVSPLLALITGSIPVKGCWRRLLRGRQQGRRQPNS